MKRALVLMVVFALFVQLGSVATLAAPIQEAAGPTVEETILATQPDAEGMPGRPDPHGSNVDRPAAATTQATSPLYPDDMDPPESCRAPLRGPFGKDEEIFLVPWLGVEKSYRTDLTPGWYPQGSITPYPLASDIAAVALYTERIVTAFEDSGGELTWRSWYSSYDDGDGDRPGGWGSRWGLGVYPDGNPALLSRHPENWVVFARVGGKIRNWEDNYRTSGTWQDIPGIVNAASDPAVISKDPHHMAVFYLDAEGAVWFTEGAFTDGGAAAQSTDESAETSQAIWRSVPVSLSGAEIEFTVYLPLITQSHSQGSARQSAATASSANLPTVGTTEVFTLTSELSVASRNENHLAVFGVDVHNQLWVREWTNWSESDWSDTNWVMLMDDVAIERPGVASRHSNHLAVAARSTSGEPFYVEWTYASGWKAPLSLSGSRGAPLTPVATSVDAISVFSVDGNKVWHKDWNEDEGWGHWLELADSEVQNGHRLTAVARRLDDLMLLGRNLDGEGMYRQYTSQSRELTKSEVLPESGTFLRSDLAWVENRQLWVRALQVPDPSPTHWAANAFDLQQEISATLALGNHPLDGTEPPPVALASGDLDLDGDEEMVVVTRVRTPSPEVTISLLDLTASPTVTVTQLATATVISDVMDISVAVGDLDGDGVKNEVALAGTVGDYSGVRLWVFEYLTATQRLEQRTTALHEWTTVNQNQKLDVEVAIGRLYPGYEGEQIVILGTGAEYHYPNPDEIFDHPATFHVDPSVPSIWQLTMITDFTEETGYSQCTLCVGWGWYDYYRSAVGTGDIDADGYDEIALFFGDLFYTIDPSADEALQEVEWPQDSRIDMPRSLALGDIDLDGRAEIVVKIQEFDGQPSKIGIFEFGDDGQPLVLTQTWEEEEPSQTAVLLGDLDNDSLHSELVGCATFTELSVIAVLNGAPRCYSGGAPIHDTDVRFARTAAGGSSSAYGTTTSIGASFSIGFAAEINVPFIGTKIGEVRGSVTQDFMSTLGHTSAREQSVTRSTGYQPEDGSTLGIVVYTGMDHTCNYYDIFSPDSPANRSRSMACRPVGNAYEDFASLEYWHSDPFKQMAGSSWADVGHRSSGGVLTNDVSTYPSSLPIDPYMLKYSWPTGTPIRVSYDPMGGVTDWSISELQGGSRESSLSFETNTTVSVGATVGIVTVDAGVTTGFGWESSRAVSWSEELEIGGGIAKFTDPSYECYTIVPYIYHAKARTQAGVVYPYLEMDYYVPGLCSALSSEDAGASPSVARPGVR